MPEHNSAASKKKAPSAGGGGKRSAGGQKLGRRAARAAVKSEEEAESLLALLEREGRVTAHLTLGRVEAVKGGGFYDVRLLDGNMGRLGLGGNIRGGRGGCFISLHDFVVVDGGALKGKLSAAEAARAKRAVAEAGIRTKKGFFAAATEDGELREEGDQGGFEWDRSDEERAEEAERAARKAAAAAEAERLARLRVLLPGRKAAAPLAAVVEEVLAPAAPALAVAEAEDEEDEDEEAAVPAAGAGGAKKAAPSGMNRAARRAAAAAAAELEEARQAFLRSKAEAEAMLEQERNGLGGSAFEYWDDEEVNVDAI
jgi:hypothetical protein